MNYFDFKLSDDGKHIISMTINTDEIAGDMYRSVYNGLNLNFPSVTNLKHLECLQVLNSYCGVKFSKEFESLTKLTELYMIDYNTEELCGLEYVTQLTKLTKEISDPSDFGGYDLPDNISVLTNLKELTLECGIVEEFAEFDYSFGNLTNLTSLSINWLSSNMTKSLNKLINLEKLNIDVMLYSDEDPVIVFPGKEVYEIDEDDYYGRNVAYLNFDKLTKLKNINILCPTIINEDYIDYIISRNKSVSSS